MRLYLAYGSNMHRDRLEERVGRVEEMLGQVLLHGYSHSFSHQGLDGSGKGNIEPWEDGLVRGVLYRFTQRQTELLHPYEGGYDMLEATVTSPSGEHDWDAYTYMAPKDVVEVLPRDFYLEHYLRGMQANGFPQSYIDSILGQAKR
jgi:gamma-glutamylcyclotransferase